MKPSTIGGKELLRRVGLRATPDNPVFDLREIARLRPCHKHFCGITLEAGRSLGRALLADIYSIEVLQDEALSLVADGMAEVVEAPNLYRLTPSGELAFRELYPGRTWTQARASAKHADERPKKAKPRPRGEVKKPVKCSIRYLVNDYRRETDSEALALAIAATPDSQQLIAAQLRGTPEVARLRLRTPSGGVFVVVVRVPAWNEDGTPRTLAFDLRDPE